MRDGVLQTALTAEEVQRDGGGGVRRVRGTVEAESGGVNVDQDCVSDRTPVSPPGGDGSAPYRPFFRPLVTSQMGVSTQESHTGGSSQRWFYLMPESVSLTLTS